LVCDDDGDDDDMQWNVTDGRVKEWANTPDMITAACFNPEGTMAVAGLFKGQVRRNQYICYCYYSWSRIATMVPLTQVVVDPPLVPGVLLHHRWDEVLHTD